MPADFVSVFVAGIFPYVFLACLLSLLFGAFKVFLLPSLKGRVGEGAVNLLASKRLDPKTYHLITDLTLPSRHGTTQIDHLIVSRYGIFVIETKMYKGWIYGGEDDARWTQVIYKKKQRFQNPLRQNFKHIKTLAELTNLPLEVFRSVIVFVGDSTFKTQMPNNVMHIGHFIKYIQSYMCEPLSAEQVADFISSVRSCADGVTEEQKANHVRNLKSAHASTPENSDSPSCPRCGRTMVRRKNRKNNSEFWGCPSYPKCRGTRNAG